MTIEEARKIIDEIIEHYGIEYSECREERRGGKVKFLDCTIKFLIDGEKRFEKPPKIITRMSHSESF